MDTAAWNQLEGYWNKMGEGRIKSAQRDEQEAVALRHDAAKARTLLAVVERARAGGDWESYRTLNLLYGKCIMGSLLRHLIIEDEWSASEDLGRWKIKLAKQIDDLAW
jgi:hypothetical protein